MTDSANHNLPASPWPHRVAVLLVCATFPLIWVGGLVTTYDAGMAVPDWPGTYGYNLFLYPWGVWLYGPFDIFIEHGHRLLGATVGLIAIALLVVVFCYDKRHWVRGLAIATLTAVIFQGLLGGLRVLNNDVQIAKIHGIFGPTFFALCVTMAVITSRLWRERTKLQLEETDPKLQRLSVITAALALCQIAVGAHLRHLPVDFSPTMFRSVVFFHLILAAALVVHIVLLGVRVFRQHRHEGYFVRPALCLLTLILLQLCLGSATWVVNYAWPTWMQRSGLTFDFTVQAGGYWQAMVVTGHQAMGSLILAFSVLLALRSLRLLKITSHSSPAGGKLTGVLA